MKISATRLRSPPLASPLNGCFGHFVTAWSFVVLLLGQLLEDVSSVKDRPWIGHCCKHRKKNQKESRCEASDCPCCPNEFDETKPCGSERKSIVCGCDCKYFSDADTCEPTTVHWCNYYHAEEWIDEWAQVELSSSREGEDMEECKSTCTQQVEMRAKGKKVWDFCNGCKTKGCPMTPPRSPHEWQLKLEDCSEALHTTCHYEFVKKGPDFECVPSSAFRVVCRVWVDNESYERRRKTPCPEEIHEDKICSDHGLPQGLDESDDCLPGRQCFHGGESFTCGHCPSMKHQLIRGVWKKCPEQMPEIGSECDFLGAVCGYDNFVLAGCEEEEKQCMPVGENALQCGPNGWTNNKLELNGHKLAMPEQEIRDCPGGNPTWHNQPCDPNDDSFKYECPQEEPSDGSKCPLQGKSCSYDNVFLGCEKKKCAPAKVYLCNPVTWEWKKTSQIDPWECPGGNPSWLGEPC